MRAAKKSILDVSFWVTMEPFPGATKRWMGRVIYHKVKEVGMENVKRYYGRPGLVKATARLEVEGDAQDSIWHSAAENYVPNIEAEFADLLVRDRGVEAKVTPVFA